MVEVLPCFDPENKVAGQNVGREVYLTRYCTEQTFAKKSVATMLFIESF